MWYKSSYRRHLCDMHIDDWDQSFLCEFSPDEYLSNLKRAKIQSAMLYFQSHVGLCYYPTKTGKIHNAFKSSPDKMRILADKCRENGISVVGYYSLIYNNWAHDTHPEWRMTDETGRSKRDGGGRASDEFTSKDNSAFRYGLCCPNNESYREFVFAQIKEICEYFSFDGMFYDMLFWPHTCLCDACRERWAREVGGDIPTREDWSDSRWLLHMKKRREWMGELAHTVTNYTKSLCPNASVEHNVAYSALPIGTTANCEEVISACDYAGGDLYRDIYSQSFACKFYRSISKNQPFEYMFSRCAPNLGAHTQLKSEDIMKSAVSLTMANHGATLVIDAIDPVGTLDERVYDRIGRVFSELLPYEEYMRGDSVEDIGLYYSLKSKYNPRGEAFTNYLGVTNASQSFIERNILHGITGGYRPLDHRVIVAPALTEEDGYDVARLVDYVKNGGGLYFSGGDCPSLLSELLSAEVTGRTAESVVYISPTNKAGDIFGHYNEKYPLSFSGSAPITDIPDGEVLATVTLPYTRQDEVRFSSIHSNPPGVKTDIPALVYKIVGKGRGVWSALPIECCEQYDCKNIFLRALTELFDYTPTLRASAPRDVEMTLYRENKEMLVNAVLLNEQENARAVEEFTVTVDCGAIPKKVTRVKDGKLLPAKINGNEITFSVRGLCIFDIFKIEL